MQTFLPYANFTDSANCLDNKRLGKQRVECLQILRTLVGQSNGWANHPAVKMWQGYETALTNYAIAVCNEWTNRGFKDTCKGKIIDLWISFRSAMSSLGVRLANETNPPWLGESAFHESHQSNLLRKDPKWYGRFGWEVSNDLPYYWPSKVRAQQALFS